MVDNYLLLQKKAIRYLFGDKAAYTDKFCTAARTRPFGQQILPPHSFYCKENTKPLFTQLKILTVHNLHRYMTTNEISKVIYSKTPSTIYNSVEMSTRNNKNLIILPKNHLLHSQFQYISLYYWNKFMKNLKIPDPHSIVNEVFKRKLKLHLLEEQKSSEQQHWNDKNIT